MPSNFDSLIDELQRRVAERSRAPVVEVVPRRPSLATTTKALSDSARQMRAVVDRMNRDPLLKGMEADGRRAVEAARLEGLAAKIRSAVAAGSVTATQASRLELELNQARRRVV